MATANPRKKRGGRKTRRNPPTATAARATVNRSRARGGRRKKRNPSTALSTMARAAVTNRKRARGGRRRVARRNNPAPMINPSLGGIGRFAVAAAVGGIGSSLVTQVMRILPIPQTGPVGLAAQVGFGFLAGWALPKTGLIKAETAALIGTIIAANGVANFAAPYTDLSSYLPAPGGMGDVQYLANGTWPFGRRGFPPPNGMADVQYMQNNDWPFGTQGFTPPNGTIAARPYV